MILEAHWDPEVYELLDCGEGRKLERVAGYVIDRPAPAARWPKAVPSRWELAEARFIRQTDQKGQWLFRRQPPENWLVQWQDIRLLIKCTPFGHIGLFPEQDSIWHWIHDRLSGLGSPCRILHLFAYTGGATLVAAATGAEVYHVDAARNVLTWAKKNVELSGLGAPKIHWICEDARRFVEREARRGRNYDALIIDPPTYGHGPKGELWHIDKHLRPLLEGCSRLVGDRCRFLVLTAHATGYTPQKLLTIAKSALPQLAPAGYLCGQMALRSATGRTLRAGIFVLWQPG
ncbi:MAG: class I SAM-dependent methyltransferase [Thermoguttaceae bacterium]|nr:class I SAM-dependent methyltransferase [Thermoguttaceae bacterium]